MNAVNTEIRPGERILRLDTSRQTDLGGLTLGDIISGTITANDGKKAAITLDNGKSFLADAKSAVAEIGSRVSFEIADVNGNSVVMKQINEENEEEREAESSDLTGEKLLNWAKGAVLPITGAAFASAKIMSEQNAENDAKMLDALNRIKMDILHSVNNVSNGALSFLAANGVSLDNVTVAMLESAVKSAAAPLKYNDVSEEDIAAAVDSYSQSSHETEHAAIVDSIKVLLEEDLPPTATNIEALQGAREKTDQISDMSAEDRVRFLRTQREATLENLFTAIHSAGGRKAVREMGDEEWNEALPGVQKYMRSEGIKSNRTTLEAVRMLMANDLPVTKENVGFLNGDLKQRNGDDIIRNAARNMSEGKSHLSVNVYEGDAAAAFKSTELFEEYREIISSLPKITDDAVSEAADGGDPVTISHLIKLSSNNENNANRESENRRRSPSFYSEKIKLEEVRLRLTLTAAAQMAKAGISIDTMELQAAIDQLKELENRTNKTALGIAGSEPSEGNIAEMAARSAKLRGLVNTPDSVKRGILTREINFTVREIAEANERARERAARDSYGAAETVPNAKYGDSVRKVLDQVEGLLEGIGIPAFPENVRAARSLIRTDADVTREQIEAIKAINNKIENVTQNLHPVVSAQMIKDGFNPLTAHIDEVIAYIDRHREIYGEPPVEAMEKAIYNMDRNGTLSKDERASLIGTYRMLSAINGNEAVSAAFIAKSGRGLTLENLMESGKYYEKFRTGKAAVDKRVDDGTKGQGDYISVGSIREQIGKAYVNALKELEESGVTEHEAKEAAEAAGLGYTAQNMELMKAVKDNEMEISGVNINTAGNIKYNIGRLFEAVKNERALEYLKTFEDRLEATDLRELMEGMEEFFENNAYYDARLSMSESAAFSTFKDDLKSLADVSPQQLAWMMTMNLPLTINNIKTVSSMTGDGNFLGKRLEELNRLAENIVKDKLEYDIPDTDLKQILDGAAPSDVLDEITEKIDEVLDKAIEADSPRKAELLREAEVIENAAGIMERTGNRYYQMPVKLHDKIGSLNVFVLNEDADEQNMSAYIRLDMTELGTIQASVNYKNGFADIIISAENQKSAKLIEENSNILHGYFKDIGLSDYRLSFNHEKATDYFREETARPSVGTGSAMSAKAAMDIRL